MTRLYDWVIWKGVDIFCWHFCWIDMDFQLFIISTIGCEFVSYYMRGSYQKCVAL
jgi:hypothetical protein